MTTIKPRTARVMIYQGDDLHTLATLDEKVAQAEVELRSAERAATNGNSTPVTLDETDTPQTALVAARENHAAAVLERDQFAEEAEHRGVTVALHAIPRKKWRELARKHAARPDVPEDSMGVNMDEFPDALLPISINREQSTISGDLDEFLDSLNDQDYYDRLFLTAFALNRGSALADPTLRLGSTPSQISAATTS